jgi:NADH-quinone oxidoreductase subunit J
MHIVGLTYFYACAAAAVAGAVFTVANPNPIRGAMGLLLMILSIAGLFMALHAQFLAIIQLIVYAGAIVVLFLFVIMLLGPSAMSPRDHRGRIVRTGGAALFGLIAAFALIASARGGSTAVLTGTDSEFGSINAFGRILFTDDIPPFELSSALLMVAVIGAVAVARGRHGDEYAAHRPKVSKPLAPHGEGPAGEKTA